MFLSHLNFFIAFIAVLLFLLRIKQKSFSEIILVLFSLFFFISSALWLLVYYYEAHYYVLIDYIGIINENILSVLAVFYIIFLGKTVTKSNKLLIIIFVITFSIVLLLVHLSISSGSNLILYPLNKNIHYNILLIIIIDLILFALFLFIFFHKKLGLNAELFDGSFKTSILFAFSFYFLQDIFVLLLMYLASIKVVVSGIIFDFALYFNFTTALFLVISAIYTNWMKEFNTVRLVKSLDRPAEINPVLINLEELRPIKNLDWCIIKSIYFSKHKKLITSIEDKHYLTKTEKMYVFFDNFQLSNKILADVLCVSVRTIETNFYRSRKKIEK